MQLAALMKAASFDPPRAIDGKSTEVLDSLLDRHSHELDDTDSDEAPSDPDRADTLSLRRLQAVTSGDWGWYTTFTDNLASVRTATPELLADIDARTVESRIDRLRAALDAAPKSMRWRARSVIGRKTAWYELPEEVDRGGPR